MAKLVYTVEEAADMLRRSPKTIRSWLSKGILRGEKMGSRVWIIPAESLREKGIVLPDDDEPSVDVS